jgi:DNA repair exonuclease SbcCD ATPase subunit
LCYGEDNYIDFRNFKQNLVILNGNNKEGKSSIIDIITRALFNESRGYKDDIINKHKDKGDITISFSVESDTYVFEQVFTRKGNHHKLLKNDEDITPASIIKTYKFIKEDIGIGQYDNFVNTTVAF